MRGILTSALVPLADDLPDVREPAEGAEAQEAEAWILSSWTLAHFCCEQVRTMVRGAWSHRRLQECQPALQRYMRSRKRKRGHQSDGTACLGATPMSPTSRGWWSLSPARLWGYTPRWCRCTPGKDQPRGEPPRADGTCSTHAERLEQVLLDIVLKGHTRHLLHNIASQRKIRNWNRPSVRQVGTPAPGMRPTTSPAAQNRWA